MENVKSEWIQNSNNYSSWRGVSHLAFLSHVYTLTQSHTHTHIHTHTSISGRNLWNRTNQWCPLLSPSLLLRFALLFPPHFPLSMHLLLYHSFSHFLPPQSFPQSGLEVEETRWIKIHENQHNGMENLRYFSATIFPPFPLCMFSCFLSSSDLFL